MNNIISVSIKILIINLGYFLGVKMNIKNLNGIFVAFDARDNIIGLGIDLETVKQYAESYNEIYLSLRKRVIRIVDSETRLAINKLLYWFIPRPFTYWRYF